MEKEKMQVFNLPSLTLPVKILFTGYLLVMGVGILMALAQILLTHGMADGELGVSVDDIVYSYHGNRNNSLLENKLKGSMSDKAIEVDKETLTRWAKNGALKEEWEEVRPIFEKNCVSCHSSAMPGLTPLDSYEHAAKVAEVDQGASIDTLTRVSHIHLFGIAFIFIFMGYIYSMAINVNTTFKSIVLFIPFLFILIDISSWWITSIFPMYAWFTIIGGFGYMMAFAVMWFTSMYQIWILPRKGKNFDSNEWIK